MCEIIMCENTPEYEVRIAVYGRVKMCPQCLSAKILNPEDGHGNLITIKSATRIA